jgi:cell division protein FtsB
MRKLTVILILLLLILQYQLWFSQNSLIDMWRLQRQLEEQKVKNDQLKERNRSLEAEVKDLKQGLEAIEERSRSELGMIRKDETFYQIVEEPPDQKE